ncbi:MAG TPA: tetratricopeptide repeat protein [Planctomycetota bacterium]
MDPERLSNLAKSLLEPDVVERMLGRYALVRKLGEGGAGVVWKAWDTKLERWVAVKEPRLDHGNARERFLREARAAARLKHPGLIQIYEADEHDGQAFIVMDFVEGRRLDETTLNPRDGAALMARVCDAVECVHAQGIVHRDIKPQNILVDAGQAPRLGDFGLAKTLEAGPLTVEGGFLGTPQYVAPEQAAGRLAEIGPRTDVYALGATLYHVLCGRPPFDGEDAPAILGKKLRGEGPRPVSQVHGPLPPALVQIVGRAMEARPEDRYPSAASLGEDLRRFLRGEEPGRRPLSLRWAKRLAPGLAVALLAAAALGTFWVRGSRDAAYETARQKGDELWIRSLGFLRGADRDGLRRVLGETMRAFERATSEAPSRPYPWLMRGRCRMLLGEKVEAERAWTRALALDPACGAALLERAKLHLAAYARLRLPSESADDAALRKKGQDDLAAARAARDLDATALKLLEGLAHLGSRDFAKAAAALRAYTDENSWDASALAMLGAAEYYGGRFDAAESTWTRVIALEPLAERYAARGHARFRLGRHEQALEDYDRAVRLAPDVADAWCDRGAALQAASQLDRAIADYSEAIARRPDLARAFVLRGTARAEKGDVEQADQDFLEAQRIAPFDVDAYVNRGVAFLRWKRTAEAVEEFDAALEIDPGHVEALSRRGVCRLLTLDCEGAMRDFEKALAIAPENPDLHFHRAQARYAKGETAKAAEELKTSLGKAPAGWARRARAEELLREWEEKK